MLTVEALLDTGFTDWLAINTQDVESLGWSFLRKHEMQTARGYASFNLYQGTVSFEEREFAIPVLGGEEITIAYSLSPVICFLLVGSRYKWVC